MTDIITNKAAQEISSRMGCDITEIEHEVGQGFVVSCEFDRDIVDRNYLTLIHAIQFNNRIVKGFVSYDDLDCMIKLKTK